MDVQLPLAVALSHAFGLTVAKCDAIYVQAALLVLWYHGAECLYTDQPHWSLQRAAMSADSDLGRGRSYLARGIAVRWTGFVMV
jgi:hypothetical protein